VTQVTHLNKSLKLYFNDNMFYVLVTLPSFLNIRANLHYNSSLLRQSSMLRDIVSSVIMMIWGVFCYKMVNEGFVKNISREVLKSKNNKQFWACSTILKVLRKT